MRRFVFGECSRGYSHICRGTGCQDSMKHLQREDGTILMAVADGHGSRSCPYSAEGSQIAVETFCDIMAQYLDAYAAEREQFKQLLRREGSLRLAQALELEWKRRILDHHQQERGPVSEEGETAPEPSGIYRLYGTTLLGVLVAADYVFAFQIGDGDILYVDSLQALPVVQGEKLLGVESHSLCSAAAWKKAVSALWQRTWSEQLPLMFMLSTDGFANSFVTDEAFLKNARDYFDLLNEHGPEAIRENLPAWLEETSRLG